MQIGACRVKAVRRLVAMVEGFMSAPTKGLHLKMLEEPLPRVLPPIRLHHGEALWVLARLGFQGKASKSTFYEYIKSLRKLGTPFEHGKIGLGRRGLANYSYCHLMELALVLTLRVYHVVPDAILAEIIRYRRTLYRHYHRAYADRVLRTRINVEVSGHMPMEVRGMFLDLQINFSGGTLTAFGPPRLLSPFEGLAAFADRDIAARAMLPINISLLSERLVATALRAPPIRTGPRPARKKRRK
jgi:hypothetical protein